MSSEAVWIAVVIGLVVATVWFMVARTARLNQDPLQHELASLLLEVLEGCFSTQATHLFVVSSTNAFIRGMVLDKGEQQTRLAHALSMLRPQLSPSHYEALRLFLRSS